MKHKIDDKLSFKWFLAVKFPIIIILPEDCSEFRGTQRECSSKPLKHSIVKRILVFKR